MWREHEPPTTLETLQETLTDIKATTQQHTFLKTLRGTAYHLGDATVVITSTKPRNLAVRLRAYNRDEETTGENYFLINAFYLPQALAAEASKLTEQRHEPTTAHHHPTTRTHAQHPQDY